MELFTPPIGQYQLSKLIENDNHNEKININVSATIRMTPLIVVGMAIISLKRKVIFLFFNYHIEGQVLRCYYLVIQYLILVIATALEYNAINHDLKNNYSFKLILLTITYIIFSSKLQLLLSPSIIITNFKVGNSN